MKSEYRQAVELVIAQEAKLAEAREIHEEAVARVTQTAEWISLNEASLNACEDRLAKLEVKLGLKPQASG
ncbi:hypothetical protein [Pseudomonas botevensis]|uniref:hypothetical protein n=1 Tax=Pseudomonas botevensis TaxID=2842352 RepID=UPI001C3E4CA1|nr:hypothetical protein [Pseudomonas botevensis]MBV4478278.1 hypothetical protein [Pseudomonas botevensis]